MATSAHGSLILGLRRWASCWDDAGGMPGCPSSCSPLQTCGDEEETLFTVEMVSMVRQPALTLMPALPAGSARSARSAHPPAGWSRPPRRQGCSAQEPLVYSPALQSQTIKEEKQLHRHSRRNGFMCKSAAFKISLSMKVHL